MKQTFEKELPEGYKKVYSITRKDKQTDILYFIIAIIPITVLIPIVYLICYYTVLGEYDAFGFSAFDFLMLLIFFKNWCLLGLIFIGLHLLFEGIACKIIHHQKATLLTNNHQISHGIYNAYIHKKAIFTEILIPHIIFAIIYLSAIIYSLTQTPLLLFCPLFTFSMHISFCVSDIHILYALLFVCKGKNALYMDNGRTILFYTKTPKTTN